jgi:hypothetical protein
MRLIEPAYAVESSDLNAVPNPWMRAAARALHCDRFGLPKDFADLLAGFSNQGQYALTHAVLAYQWTLENRCGPLPDPDSFTKFASNALRALVADPEVVQDLRIESLAMLIYAQWQDLTDPSWAQPVLETQQADGGWKPARDWPESHPHTTVLALWVLLAARYPAAPVVPMIADQNPGT